MCLQSVQHKALFFKLPNSENSKMPNPIKLNLVSLRYRGKRMEHSIIVGATLILLIISGYNVYSGFRNRIEIFRYEKRIEQIEKGIRTNQRRDNGSSPTYKREEIATVRQQMMHVNQIIAKDVFPWGRLLDILEQEMPPAVTLERFSTKNQFKTLYLSGRSASVDAISIFLKQLEKSVFFHSVELGNLDFQKSNAVKFKIKGQINFQALLPQKIYGDLWKIM
jgi:hypothetical protein